MTVHNEKEKTKRARTKKRQSSMKMPCASLEFEKKKHAEICADFFNSKE